MFVVYFAMCLCRIRLRVKISGITSILFNLGIMHEWNDSVTLTYFSCDRKRPFSTTLSHRFLSQCILYYCIKLPQLFITVVFVLNYLFSIIVTFVITSMYNMLFVLDICFILIIFCIVLFFIENNR